MSDGSESGCDSSVVEHLIGNEEVGSSILPRSTIIRFWEKVDNIGRLDCWPWLGAHDRYGYGAFRAKSRMPPRSSHRVAWEISRGAIPRGMHVLHSCDNPACCNPAHLRLGSHQDNMTDKKLRGRVYKGGPRPKAEVA